MFKKNVFPQKVDLAYNVNFWQLCWNFLSNLKSKSLKVRSYWVRSIFFKKFVFYQLFLWTFKMHFRHFCGEISTENLERFRLKTEEDCEKKPFFQRKYSSWRRCYRHVNAVRKIVSKNFESKVRILFAHSLKTRRRFFCLKDTF